MFDTASPESPRRRPLPTIKWATRSPCGDTQLTTPLSVPAMSTDRPSASLSEERIAPRALSRQVKSRHNSLALARRICAGRSIERSLRAAGRFRQEVDVDEVGVDVDEARHALAAGGDEAQLGDGLHLGEATRPPGQG